MAGWEGTGDFFDGGPGLHWGGPDTGPMGEESPPPPILPILENPATILDHESDLGLSLQYITDHKATFLAQAYNKLRSRLEPTILDHESVLGSSLQ